MSRLPADRARMALIRALRPAAGPFDVLAADSRDWASALFVGARHCLTLALDGEDARARAERLCVTLAEMELDLDGGFVADLQLMTISTRDRPVLTIEALTIDDAETFAVSRGVRRAG